MERERYRGSKRSYYEVPDNRVLAPSSLLLMHTKARTYAHSQTHTHTHTRMKGNTITHTHTDADMHIHAHPHTYRGEGGGKYNSVRNARTRCHS